MLTCASVAVGSVSNFADRKWNDARASSISLGGGRFVTHLRSITDPLTLLLQCREDPRAAAAAQADAAARKASYARELEAQIREKEERVRADKLRYRATDEWV